MPRKTGTPRLPTTGANIDGVVVTAEGRSVVLLPAAAAAFIGAGDVVGPASATDNALARFDGTSGKLLQSGLVVEADDGRLTTVTDPTGPQDAATKAYVDAAVGGGGGGGGGSWIPLALGTEPLAFVSDGAGHPILVAYP